MDAFLKFVGQNQTLIVGILGFVGVIFTLRFNAQQTREQHREEVHHECQTLRAALIEELKINQGALEQDVGEVNEDGGYYVPTDPMDDVYRAFIHRLGLLSPMEVEKVMFAYLSLRTFNAKLFLIGVPVHTSDRHVQVPAKNSELLSGLYKSLIDPVNEAIQALERERA